MIKPHITTYLLSVFEHINSITLWKGYYPGTFDEDRVFEFYNENNLHMPPMSKNKMHSDIDLLTNMSYSVIATTFQNFWDNIEPISSELVQYDKERYWFKKRCITCKRLTTLS